MSIKGKPVSLRSPASRTDMALLCLFAKAAGWRTACSSRGGQTFVQSSEALTGMCRSVRTGGTWELPTFVTDVK